MSNVEDDYSDYIKHMSNINRNYSTLAAFALTILALLIALLPDPNRISAQVTLFFVAFLFQLSGFVAGWGTTDLIYFCRNVPPLTRQLKIFNYLSIFDYAIYFFIPGLLLLVVNLVYLALVSWFVSIVFVIAEYVVCWKPFGTYRATRARILARAREKKEVV